MISFFVHANLKIQITKLACRNARTTHSLLGAVSGTDETAGAGLSSVTTTKDHFGGKKQIYK